MEQYINKSALLAEIERRKKEWSYGSSTEAKYKVEAYKELIEWLDTIEVTEVDFEKELDRIWFDNKLGDYFDNNALDFAHIRTICKHFYSLGLKAQKGEK